MLHVVSCQQKIPQTHPNTRIRSRNRPLNCQSPALRRSTASCIGSEFEAPAMRCQCPVDTWSFSPLFSGRDPHHPRNFHGFTPIFLARFSMEIFWSKQPWKIAAPGHGTQWQADHVLCVGRPKFSVCRPWMKKREPTKAWNRDVISDVSSAIFRFPTYFYRFSGYYNTVHVWLNTKGKSIPIHWGASITFCWKIWTFSSAKTVTFTLHLKNVQNTQ